MHEPSRAGHAFPIIAPRASLCQLVCASSADTMMHRIFKESFESFQRIDNPEFLSNRMPKRHGLIHSLIPFFHGTVKGLSRFIPGIAYVLLSAGPGGFFRTTASPTRQPSLRHTVQLLRVHLYGVGGRVLPCAVTCSSCCPFSCYPDWNSCCSMFPSGPDRS